MEFLEDFREIPDKIPINETNKNNKIFKIFIRKF